MDTNDYTKESIKGRMFKRAAALWDVKDIDNLDPIVKLMIEALAGEVFNLSGELQEVETRIFDKIASELTPDVLITAKPAHGVLHASPLVPEKFIGTDTEFHYKNADEVKHASVKRLVFTPLSAVRLVGGRVKCIISGGDYYAVGKKMIKEKTARPLRYGTEFERCLWIGLDLAPEVGSLNNLSFYFDFPYIEDKNDLFMLLPFIKWKLGKREIEMRAGNFRPQTGTLEKQNGYWDRYDAAKRASDEIQALYEKRFLTVKCSNLNDLDGERCAFPEEIKDLYDPKIVEGEKTPLVWIKAEFPPHFPGRAINDLFVSINAFPVANRYRVKASRTIDHLSSIVLMPKEAHEFFLAIDTVADENGKTYQELDLATSSAHGHGLYALRRGGAEKFSNSDAQNYLSRLVTLLRDESIAFSKAEKDVLNENTNVLLKRINHLDHKLARSSTKCESPTYLLVDHTGPNALKIDLEYWLTNGPAGNGLGAAEKLHFVTEPEVEANSAIMLTTSRGGAAAPNATDRTRLFKHALVARDSIYSKADIVSFCIAAFGEQITDVEVTKGYATNLAPAQGIQRTIDVLVKARGDIDSSQLAELKENLLSSLRLRAPDDFYFRILFTN